jgi:protein-arginine kinase activator protein McsA
MKDKDGKEDTIHIPCAICNEKPASILKGGVYDDKRDMWFVCKECLPKINDHRNGDRRRE